MYNQSISGVVLFFHLENILNFMKIFEILVGPLSAVSTTF